MAEQDADIPLVRLPLAPVLSPSLITHGAFLNLDIALTAEVRPPGFITLGGGLDALLSLVYSLPPSISVSDLFDIYGIHHGRYEAAERLARRLAWNPDRAVNVRAKALAATQAKRTKAVALDALITGLARVGAEMGSQLPVVTSTNYVRRDDGTIETRCPLLFSVTDTFHWLCTEAKRCAVCGLLDQPYAAAIVLEEGHAYCETPLLEISLRPFKGQGRPRGTGTFSSREELTKAIATAWHMLRDRNARVTQEAVANLLHDSNLAGGEDPARQLRRWCRYFGFSWDEALSAALGK